MNAAGNQSWHWSIYLRRSSLSSVKCCKSPPLENNTLLSEAITHIFCQYFPPNWMTTLLTINITALARGLAARARVSQTSASTSPIASPAYQTNSKARLRALSQVWMSRGFRSRCARSYGGGRSVRSSGRGHIYTRGHLLLLWFLYLSFFFLIPNVYFLLFFFVCLIDYIITVICCHYFSWYLY